MEKTIQNDLTQKYSKGPIIIQKYQNIDCSILVDGAITLLDFNHLTF